LDPLNFPLYDIKTRELEGKRVIFDVVRRKWVPLLPEEWVRQHAVQYLLQEKGYPAGLLSIEKGFHFQGMPQRADIVAYNRQGEAVLMVECKAPAVQIEQAVFDQAARYNRVIRAGYLFVTNGLQHYCCQIDWAAQRYQFVDDIPAYDAR
jgi:type I site-specific restriction endonuclease